MAKGPQSWSAQESGAPVSACEQREGDGTNLVSFSSTTRAILTVRAPSGTENLTLNLAGGGSINIPGAAVASVFAPGSILPFACDSFKFGGGESTFLVIGLF